MPSALPGNGAGAAHWPTWSRRAATPLLSAAAYALFLPWDLRNRPETPGALQETTPVSPWGVVALAATLLALSFWSGRSGEGLRWSIPLTAAPPMALLYASLATHEAPDASPWPVAWAFFGALMVAGVATAAALGRAGARHARARAARKTD